MSFFLAFIYFSATAFFKTNCGGGGLNTGSQLDRLLSAITHDTAACLLEASCCLLLSP
jgi:hypothetical protein